MANVASGGAFTCSQSRQVHHQRSRIECDQYVRFVAGRGDVVATELDLKRRYPVAGARGSANLSGKIRQGGKIVTAFGRSDGELLSLQVEKEVATCGEVKSLAEHKLAAIDEKIVELEKMKAALLQITEACAGGQESAVHCTILNALEA